ncbi:hypothetical protein MTO96_030474 [Rhipicephalus appendiculatus]
MSCTPPPKTPTLPTRPSFTSCSQSRRSVASEHRRLSDQLRTSALLLALHLRPLLPHTHLLPAMSTGLPTRSVRLKPPLRESLQLLTPC